MNKTILIMVLILSISIIRPQENIFTSKEHNISIVFPNEVEAESPDPYSHVFTSFELIDDLFILYQVQVLNERPDAPLQYKTKEEYQTFLFGFLKTLQLGYDNSVVLKKNISHFNDRYYSISYEFKGNWINNLLVYNKGIVILNDNRLTKISLIYSYHLHKEQFIDTKYSNFINSFNFIK